MTKSPVLVLAFSVIGCHAFPIVDSTCKVPPAPACEEEVIHVKAPPQKVVIQTEQPEETKEAAPAPKAEPERAPAPERSQREAAPAQREASPESVAGALTGVATAATILSQVNAIAEPLTTVSPGAKSLGIGITFIHIPIPVPRIFAVQETPTVRVPLTPNNVMVAPGMVPGMAAAPSAQERISRREIAEAITEAVRAEREMRQNERSLPPVPDSDRERKELEAQLSAAADKIEKLTSLVEAMERQSTQATQSPGQSEPNLDNPD